MCLLENPWTPRHYENNFTEEHKKTTVLAQVLGNPALLPSERIVRVVDDVGRTWVIKALCFGIVFLPVSFCVCGNGCRYGP